MIDFDVWWNSAAADEFRAKHEDMDGSEVRPIWAAALLANVARAAAFESQIRAAQSGQRAGVPIEAVAKAYGYLWHVNEMNSVPAPNYEPAKAAYAARKVLREFLTHEQRGAAINEVGREIGRYVDEAERAAAPTQQEAEPSPADQLRDVKEQNELLDFQNDRLRNGMHKMMARLTSLLDEDQFAEMEQIAKSAGVEPPAAQQQGEPIRYEALEQAALEARMHIESECKKIGVGKAAQQQADASARACTSARSGNLEEVPR